MKTNLCFLAFVISLLATGCGTAVALGPPVERPNIVLIMADDLGYSDLGAYGGEIRTPRIDQLANGGVRFTQFTTTSRCCPSRAALLTGREQHSVEMGWMTAVDEHRAGYRGQLTDAVPTIAEILKDNGYGTYMSGKWHLTVDGNFRGVDAMKPNGSWPTDRGFDQYFGGLTGGGDYYDVKSLLRNETHITEMPEGFYYTDAITRHALEFIEMHDAGDPLFLYLAHYAPHRRLQAPEARIANYRDMYSVGYDVLREARFERLKDFGMVGAAAELPLHASDFDGDRPSWDSLTPEQQDAWVEEMSTYAAMVEIMDDGIGAVVDALKAKKMYANTVFLFLSDNGATMEGGEASQLAASLSNTPFRKYKQYTYFGGTKSPLLVHYPKGFAGLEGSIREDWAHIMDILPTCLDVAGIDYPVTFNGKPIPAPDGISLLPAIENKPMPERDLFFEHQSSSAIISDGWKLVRLSERTPWELYKLSDDPFEQNDMSESQPAVAQRLAQRWTQWAEASDVLPLESLPWGQRIKFYKTKSPDQDGID